jgi:hypothetical protein
MTVGWSFTWFHSALNRRIIMGASFFGWLPASPTAGLQIRGIRFLMVWLWLIAQSPAADSIQFNRDIRPILSDNCFFCHGPDGNTRHADLRLDTPDGLSMVIVPNDPEGSHLYRRIATDEVDQRMPPPDSHKQLSPEQIDLVRAWIQQGAVVQSHWSFLPLLPLESAVPSSLVSADPPTSPSRVIDAWIDQQLEKNNLTAAPSADRLTLARRLYFDLLGLPPSAKEVAAFVSDTSESAVERLVDQLLESPHFGERMAVWWLDLVRYADTVGYHGDQEVSVWPFRDYVIDSFNGNKPFDQFTIEQLSGDLLPNAGQEQMIASGYNRLGMMSAEGGVQDKEYLAKYIAERVRNVSGTWLGITMGCCECHDHKFDPLTTREFYQMEAFFADIKERGLYAGANSDGNWGPAIRLPSEAQQKQLELMEEEIGKIEAKLAEHTDQLVQGQAEWEQEQLNRLTAGESSPETPGDSSGEIPPEIASILKLESEQRSSEQVQQLAEHYRRVTPLLDADRKRLEAVRKSKADLESQIPSTLVTESVQPRPVRVLPRGNWMDDSGELVEPGFPVAISAGRSQPTSDRRMNRLDLAKWIVSNENPLTARVFVNRIWKLLFGEGLSRSVDDLGAQGESPSHPELLDFLAGEFIASGWDVKQLIRTIVLSRAYQRSSLAPPEAIDADLPNHWLARQGRFRLDAEFVRDNVLAVSGLLVTQVGGPSVKPYQPPGYWAYLNFPTREWKNGSGEELYRRGLYTHWQRQYLHPSLLAFDAPNREECTATRPRSNTPLQSLALLNDPSYVEAARVFAGQLLMMEDKPDVELLEIAFQRALSRSVRDEEVAVLVELLQHARLDYEENVDAVSALLQVGQASVMEGVDRRELAAWTAVTRTILNLPELITRY